MSGTPQTGERQASRRVVFHMVAALRQAAFGLAEAAVSGDCDDATWRAGMLAMLSEAHGRCARLGSGGEPGQNEQAELDDRQAALSAVLSDDPEESDSPWWRGRVARLAAQLPSSIWNTYVCFERRSAQAAGASWERRLPGAGCCAGCLALASFGWQPVGLLPGPGEDGLGDPCGCSCSCRFDYGVGASRPGDGEVEGPVLAVRFGARAGGAALSLAEAHAWCDRHCFRHGSTSIEPGGFSFPQKSEFTGLAPGVIPEGAREVVLDRDAGVSAVLCATPASASTATFAGDCESLTELSPDSLRSLSPAEAARLASCSGLSPEVREILEDVAESGGHAAGGHTHDLWSGKAWLNPGSGGRTGKNPGNSLVAGFASAGESSQPWSSERGPRDRVLAHLLAQPDPRLAVADILPFAAGGNPTANPHLAEAARLVTQANLNEASSRRAYWQYGEYAPARRALHARLLESALNPAAVATTTPLAVLALGAPCAGKSSLAWELARDRAPGWTRLSPGEVTPGLPEYQGWNDPLLHDEASDVLRQALSEAMRRRHNLFIEHAGRDADEAAALLDRLSAAGYDLHLIHLQVEPAQAAARAAARFLANPFGLVARHQSPPPYVNPLQVREDIGTLPDAAYQELRDHPGVSSWESHAVGGLPGSALLLDRGQR